MHVTVLTFAAILAAADDAKSIRYDIAPDLKAFPQNTPQMTLESVVKAAETKRFNYLAAQLADPGFIDDRVRRLYGGRFAAQVEDTQNRLDERNLALLRRFLKDGTWQVEKDNATVTLKDLADRSVSFRLFGGRWFIQNRNR